MAVSKNVLRRTVEDQSWLEQWDKLIKCSGEGSRDMEELADQLAELELKEYVTDLELKGLGE
jgi:hypothetical protein